MSVAGLRSGKDGQDLGKIEGQKVYIPDKEIAWARATVVRAIGKRRFQVKLDSPKARGCVQRRRSTAGG
ncbi:unnamed protein product, partial [Discosporangium mesarthrocarpum]